MNKVLTVLCVWLVLLCTAATAAAGDDIKATVSLKTWYNSWEEKDENLSGGTDTRDFGSSLMAGPALTLRFGSVLLGASYLVSLQGYEPEGEGGGALTYDRKDLDLTLTYMFAPRFGVFLGYKSIDSPISVKDTGEDFGTRKIKGPGCGITGSIPFGEALAMYGNLAALMLEKNYHTSSKEFSFDMIGGSAELGLAYAFTSSVSASVGFKGQYFSGNDDVNDLNHSSTFLGLTAGLNYTF